MIYAILDADGNCINRTVWDGQTDWQPPEGCTAVPDPNGTFVLTTNQDNLLAPESVSVQQKLEAAGLTVDELKQLLGLT